MKPVYHFITTIERGGAENQLLTLVADQVSSGRTVIVLPLKGEPDLLDEFKAVAAEVNLDFCGLGFVKQIALFRKNFRLMDAVFHSHLPRAEVLVFLGNPKGFRFNSRHNAEPFFPGAPSFFSSFLSRIVTRKTICVIAISNAVKNFLISRKEIAATNKIQVVHYGFPVIDHQAVTSCASLTRVELGFTPDDFIIGAVGRLVEQKDYPTLLKGFAVAASKNSHLKLLVLGDGELREKLVMLAIELKIENKVVWLGKVDDVPKYMAIMELFVLPSLYEGFGLVLLEAMSLDVPVIASANPTSLEVLGQARSCFFPVGDYKSLADLIELSTHEGASDRVTLEQRLRLDFFSVHKMRSSLDQIYKAN